MPTALLDDRALISIAGPEAEPFLQNLITTDLDALPPDSAKPGALLSPQGKILFDFLISRAPDGFALECRADVADDFIRRLTMYRLRAKVMISKLDQSVVAISWPTYEGGSQTDSSGGRALLDLRFPDAAPVWRWYGFTGSTASQGSWHAFRIAKGIAESGSDYDLGDAFPHDVLLDQTGGVSFRKGCYVGQEVVSRMHHRGTARRRVLIATGHGALPTSRTEILAGGRPIGALGSVAGVHAIAIVRIDKVRAALDDDVAITAGGVVLDLSIPPWANFTFPQAAAAEQA